MSMRQIKVIVDGKSFEVGVSDPNASPMQVVVNGKSYSVELESAEAKPAVVMPRPVTVAKPISKPVAQPVSSGGTDKSIKAPMPGTILDIKVKAGDSVTRGQQLCALEAMKMKSAVRAPREGVIASVEVENGQKVAFGTVIVVFA
jgi:biotin carboxyl carrier protein